jgi:hypothetical protein
VRRVAAPADNATGDLTDTGDTGDTAPLPLLSPTTAAITPAAANADTPAVTAVAFFT